MFSTELTELDQNFLFEFYDDENNLGFLSGMSSVHDNYAEDRVYKFDFTIPNGFTIQLSSCHWQKINFYDLASPFTHGTFSNVQNC